jgi:hypothetical protein
MHVPRALGAQTTTREARKLLFRCCRVRWLAGWLGVLAAVCNYFISRACCGCILYDSAGAPAAASIHVSPARRLVVRVRAGKTPGEQNLIKRFNLIITQGANGCKTKEN